MDQPNFIVFITDDQGYGDLSCMGAPDLETPSLDRLASEGVRFTNWYSNAPVCSPARAALLSGRYPGNAGVRSILAGHRTATGLPTTTPTLPAIFRDHGYRCYMAGKWHLGMAEQCRPRAHGFHHWTGHLAGCIDYFSHIFYWGMNKPGPGVNPTHDWWVDDEEAWPNGEYATHLITRAAIDYLHEAAREDKPFVLYVAYNAPHYPMHAPEQAMQQFAHLPWDRQVMAAMIAEMDRGVGEIMDQLRALGLADNTCTFFMSDNGPSRETRNWLDGTLDPYYGGGTGGLKGHKFSLFEGGIRVPGLMHWPALLKGGQVLDTPAAGIDVLPTFLDAAGIDTASHSFDGISLLPHLTEGTPLPDRPIYFEQQGQRAVRQGPWKLVLDGRLKEGIPAEDSIHLANLEEDPSESTNLAKAEPAKTAELTSLVESWHAGIEQTWQQEFQPAKNGTV